MTDSITSADAPAHGGAVLGPTFNIALEGLATELLRIHDNEVCSLQDEVMTCRRALVQCRMALRRAESMARARGVDQDDDDEDEVGARQESIVPKSSTVWTTSHFTDHTDVGEPVTPAPRPMPSRSSTEVLHDGHQERVRHLPSRSTTEALHDYQDRSPERVRHLPSRSSTQAQLSAPSDTQVFDDDRRQRFSGRTEVRVPSDHDDHRQRFSGRTEVRAPSDYDGLRRRFSGHTEVRVPSDPRSNYEGGYVGPLSTIVSIDGPDFLSRSFLQANFPAAISHSHLSRSAVSEIMTHPSLGPGGSSSVQASRLRLSMTRSGSVPSIVDLTLHHCWEFQEEWDNNVNGERMQTRGSQSVMVTAHDVRRRGWGGMRKKTRSMTKEHGVLTGFSQLEDSGVRPWLMVHPQSETRLFWSLCCFMVILYDMIMLPLLVFDFETSSFTRVMEWFGAIFWTLDVVINFRTGYFDRNAHLHMKWFPVARHYFRTFFWFDMGLAAATWGTLAADDSLLASSASVLRLVRGLKFLRLLRLMKVVRLIRHFLESIASLSLLLFSGTIIRFAALLYICHVFACIWYEIGSSASGWIFRVDTQIDDQGNPVDLSYLYLMSLHWSIMQFIGGSSSLEVKKSSEILFSSIVLLTGLLICSIFISSIVSMMEDLQRVFHERKLLQTTLQEFIRNHKITPNLAKLAKSELNERAMDRQQQEVRERLFQLLPGNLVNRLQIQIELPILNCHPLFSDMLMMHPHIGDRLCVTTMRGVETRVHDTIFVLGDHSLEMYFVSRGRFIYSESLKEAKENESRKTHISKGDWVSEAALWCVSWKHTGEFYSDSRGSDIFAIDSGRFQNLLSLTALVPVKLTIIPYARTFVEAIVEHGCTDLGPESPPGEGPPAIARGSTTLDSTASAFDRLRLSRAFRRQDSRLSG